MRSALLAIDTLPIYDEIRIMLAVPTLFILVVGAYIYVPKAAPENWKHYGVHVGVAALLCGAVIVLPHETTSYGDRALHAGLALTVIVIGQSVVFARQRRTLRKNRRANTSPIHEPRTAPKKKAG